MTWRTLSARSVEDTMGFEKLIAQGQEILEDTKGRNTKDRTVGLFHLETLKSNLFSSED